MKLWWPKLRMCDRKCLIIIGNRSFQYQTEFPTSNEHIWINFTSINHIRWQPKKQNFVLYLARFYPYLLTPASEILFGVISKASYFVMNLMLMDTRYDKFDNIWKGGADSGVSFCLHHFYQIFCSIKPGYVRREQRENRVINGAINRDINRKIGYLLDSQLYSSHWSSKQDPPSWMHIHT